MRIKLKLKDRRDNIRRRMQRAKKGYSDQDIYSIHDWFIEIFPKMLDEFVECTCGCPMNEEEIIEEVKGMSKGWLEEQRAKINKLGKKYDLEYNLNDSFVCWLLILLRMKHCFEMCDEWHKGYERYNNSKNKEDWFEQAKLIEKHKKEAFYLMEKYFFNLWW